MLFNMLEYIAPRDFALKTAKNKLHSMIVVGGMGSGKTTWTLSLIARGVEELLARGRDESEILVVHALETNMTKAIGEIASSVDLKNVKYLYWFSDDAPATAGMHSRRSMSEENVSESQFYTVIRHRLEKKGFNGFIFVAHATQVYNLIDITFRRLAKIKAFKDYPDEPGDLKIIGPMLGKVYLRKLAEISYKIWSPRNENELIDGLSTAVVRFIRKKKTVKVEKRDLPDGIFLLRIDNDVEPWNDGTEYNSILIEVVETGIKVVRRRNRIDLYKRNNGTYTPIIRVKWNARNGSCPVKLV